MDGANEVRLADFTLPTTGGTAVPVCLSSSHIAFGSIRMEPVFMVLAESAALAAVMAIDGNCDIHAVPYNRLSAGLLQAKQVLVWSPQPKSETAKQAVPQAKQRATAKV